MKMVCRRPTTDEKREKMAIVGRRNAENDKKGLSSADETKNTAKTARRRPTMSRIAHFLPVARERNAKSSNFCSSLQAPE